MTSGAPENLPAAIPKEMDEVEKLAGAQKTEQILLRLRKQLIWAGVRAVPDGFPQGFCLLIFSSAS
jgi:hypothetical protein